MATFLGNERRFLDVPKACLRYVLDIEEWQQLVDSTKSLSQLKRTWVQISRFEERLKSAELANTLLRAFGRRGSVKYALLVFDSIVVKNPDSWTLVLSAIAFSRCFVGSGFKCTLNDAKESFENGDKSVGSWNTMLTAYAQAGHLAAGKQLFDQMPVRDQSSWSSLLAAVALNGDVVDAVEVLERTPVWCTKAWSAMLAAYAWKGDTENARLVFDTMPLRGVLDWNILMTLHCSIGGLESEIQVLRLMVLNGMQLDELTFVCLLLGCPSVHVGQRFFWRMIHDYGLKPSRLHYNCIVDLVHRSGYIQAHTKRLFKSLPSSQRWAVKMAASQMSNME